MAFKAIIYDLDGTLYCSRGLKRKVLFSDFVHFPLFIAERRARRALAGKDLGPQLQMEFFAEISSRAHVSIDMARTWFYQTYRREICRVLKDEEYRPKVGIQKTLDECRASGIKLVVLSDYPAVENKLEAIGLRPALFDILADGLSRGCFKPSARVLLDIASELGIEPQDICVIGDRQDTDGVAAIEAGMTFVKVKNRE